MATCSAMGEDAGVEAGRINKGDHLPKHRVAACAAVQPKPIAMRDANCVYERELLDEKTAHMTGNR